MPRIQEHQPIDTLPCVDNTAISDPIAQAKLVISKRGHAYFQVISCPYCGSRTHQHGVPASYRPGDPPGHRSADCLTPAQRLDGFCGYELQLVEDARS